MGWVAAQHRVPDPVRLSVTREASGAHHVEQELRRAVARRLALEAAGGGQSVCRRLALRPPRDPVRSVAPRERGAPRAVQRARVRDGAGGL